MALGKIGKPGLEYLVKAAVDEDYDRNLRNVALKEISYVKDQRAVIPLIRLLKDRDSEIRRYALYALEEIKDRRSLEPIRKTVENDNSKDIRRIARDVLKKIEKPDK